MSLQDDGRRVVSNLRSRLGFRSRKQADDYDDYDGYDDYDDYGDDYGDNYADYSDDTYDDYSDEAYDDPNSTYDKAYDSYAPATSRMPRSRRTDTGPRLVSFKDVQQNINASRGTYGDNVPPRYDLGANDNDAPSSNPFERTMVDSSLPPQMTPEGTAEVARRASNGLDSLFTPTGDAADYAAYDASATAYNDQQASYNDQQASFNDPYNDQQASYNDPQAAYSNQQTAPVRQVSFTQDTIFAQHADSDQHTSSAQHAASAQDNAAAGFTDSFFDAQPSFDTFTPQRTLCVLKLVSYREVEKVVNALLNDEVVILQLRNAPERVFPRILDFSFGAACALGAAVECVGEKTFAIARGGALTDAERMELHGQGVL